MLSTLLEKLEIVLNDCKIKLNKSQLNSLAEALSFYKGGIIPISVIRRELRLTNEEVADLMIYMETKGILKSKYKVYCPSKSEGVMETFYDDVRQIPKKYCDKCDENCMYLENIVVVFEVI